MTAFGTQRAISVRGAAQRLLVPAAYLAVALSLWTFAGFHRLPAWEAWRIFDGFSNGANGWWLTPTSDAFAGHALRPLEVFPHQIAFVLTPNSFVGLNVVSMLAFVARALAAYVVLRELSGRRDVAFAAGLIFALSPAADGAMLDRTVHVQWSSALAVASFAALFSAIKRDALPFAVLSACLISASLLMYEAPLPVAILLPAFSIWWARGRRRRAALYTGIYAVGLAAAIGYSLWIRAEADASYQDLIATTRRPLFDHEGLAALQQAIGWDFGGFFVHAITNDLPMERPALTLGAIMVGLGIAVLALLALFALPCVSSNTVDRRGFTEGVALSTAWIVASLAIFLPYLPYRYETLRVHSVSQFGFALLFALVAALVIGRHRIGGVVLLTCGVAAASFVAVQNAAMWRRWSDFQSATLSDLARNLQATKTRTVVVRDPSDRLSHIYECGPSGLFLGVAYRLMTGDATRKIIICNISGVAAVGFGEMGPCMWTKKALTVRPLPGYPAPAYRVPRSEILDLTLGAGDPPQLRRTELKWFAQGRGAVPDGLRGRLPCMVGQSCAEEAVAANLQSAPFKEDFDRRYSYEDVPVRGAPIEGLGPIQVNGPSWRWTISTHAAIFGRLEAGRYRVKVEVLRAYDPANADRVAIAVNGEKCRTERTHGASGAFAVVAECRVREGSPIADRVEILAPLTRVPEEANGAMGVAIDSIAIERSEGAKT